MVENSAWRPVSELSERTPDLVLVRFTDSNEKYYTFADRYEDGYRAGGIPLDHTEYNEWTELPK